MRSIFVVLTLLSLFASDSLAFLGMNLGAKYTAKKVFSSADNVLPESKIDDFVKMVQKKGDVKKVGKLLDDMKLPNEVLEDTYMRIIVKQDKISYPEANSMYKNLAGKEGFRTTLRKVSGISDTVTRGHLSELRLANKAAENGFDVVAIGRKFSDGIKDAATDIDVLLRKGKLNVAIENKDYEDMVLSKMDIVRADMDSLVAFKKSFGELTVPVFRFTNKPTNPNVLKAIQVEARKRGVEVIYGDTDAAIIQIAQLVKIAGA